MSSTLSYRIASVLLALYALAHTFGFRRPADRPDGSTVAALMRSTHVTVQGSRRTFWDFYVGFGLFATVFLLLSALLAWQLGGLSADALARVPWAATWGLAITFAVLTVMTWRYFFVAPVVFSSLITLLLFLGAWSAGKR